MTHLSDFSFLQRMVSFGYLYIWYTYRVWTLDKFHCLHPKRFRQGELKSIVTLLILFMIPFQLFYDITSVKIKYEEGFANVLGRIYTKPEIMWTKADKSLVIPTEYSLCIGFSLQTGTLVLLQCFWNYLANSVAKASFMSSKEFMFYICWTFSSFIVFPVLQYNFSRDIYEPTYKEIMPEMVYGIELFIVACLGVVSHFRFRRLLRSSRDTANGRSITQKIRYFQEVNVVLSTVLFGHGTLLTILSCDGLTNSKYLNIHKFSADFFICNINMCAVITWFCMILIFHPKHNSQQNPDDEFSEDNNNTNNKQTEINNNSGISSNYAHASTLVVNNSQVSSEYMYKGNSSSVHPLSQSGTCTGSQITNCDSAFQFGPLPITPHVGPSDSIAYRNKNNSIASTAPSMTTLVSHHNQHSVPNIHHGSNGKSSCSRSQKGSITGDSHKVMDYFPVNMNSNEDMYYHQQQEKTLQELQITTALKNHPPIPPSPTMGSEEEEIEYVPPPLSPARKNRDVINTIRPTVSNSIDRRQYTHSMMIVPCDEDMGEFGVSPSASHYNNKNHHRQPTTKRGEEEEEQRPPSTTFDHFQKQQAMNNSMLTSFRELGGNGQQQQQQQQQHLQQPSFHMSMSHSTSSLLLPLPFEINASPSMMSNLGERVGQQQQQLKDSTFGFLPPPPSSPPPPPPSSNPFQ